MVKTKTKFIPSFRVSEDVHNIVIQLAEQDKRTITDYCRVVIERHCEKNTPTEEVTEDGSNY